jgi:hypothetical protein
MIYYCCHIVSRNSLTSVFDDINWKPAPLHTAISFGELISHHPLLKKFNSRLI